MAGVDHRIYQGFQSADPFGAYSKGLQIREQMDQRAQREAEMQRLAQERDQKAKLSQIYQQGVVQNPDGTTSFDMNKVLAGMGGLENNQFAGEAAMNIGNTMYSRGMEDRKYADLNSQREFENKIKQGQFDQSQQKGLWDREMQQAQMGKIRAETSQLNQKPTDKASRLTEAEKTVDKEFGKDYADWISGASANTKSEIAKLRAVTNQLRDGSVTTGGLTGMFPDRMTSNKILNARADVQSTIMNSLRSILGAAFTEKEGERVINNTWNEADSTENNLARLERLAGDLADKADAKDAQSKYYEQNRTLSGYKPVSELNMRPTATRQDNEAVRWAQQNPNDPRSAQILKANGFGG